MQLDGMRIIVTGGAQGIGASAVRAFAAEGAHVVSFDLRADLGQDVATRATARGPGRVDFVAGDVSVRPSVMQGFDTAVGLLGGLDALVHAAGIIRQTPAEQIPEEEWDLLFAVNARGTMLTNQAAFPHLREHGGRIVNFASGAGITGLPGAAHYSAAKSAVLGWTRTVAKEWGKYRITVNAVSPAIETGLLDTFLSTRTSADAAEHRARLAASIPLGAKGDPDTDMAPVLVFLVSQGAGFITGQTIAVDGGLNMVR
jgi:NAD(P)-dependent dehydrogenase (short-subunit alcohol dehydrogenase family)